MKDDDGDDGTGCDERRCYSRSCSVSIQTVVVVAGTSSVLPCPRTGRRPGYAWTVVGCGPGRGGVLLRRRIIVLLPLFCFFCERFRFRIISLFLRYGGLFFVFLLPKLFSILERVSSFKQRPLSLFSGTFEQVLFYKCTAKFHFQL